VAQEALQNASKYSGSDRAVVTLRAIDDQIELTVEDKGAGFSKTSDKMTKGLGMTSMQERVRHVGGEFSINSEPSRGTTVRVSIPMNLEPQCSANTHAVQ
jgi:signal transduction histidine kinase